jgi:hypothetical protein
LGSRRRTGLPKSPFSTVSEEVCGSQRKFALHFSFNAFTTSPHLLESSTIVDYGMKAIGQLLDKIFYLLLSELLKKIPKKLI